MKVYHYILGLILGLGIVCLIVTLVMYFVQPSIAPAYAVLGISLMLFGMISLGLIQYDKRKELTVKAWLERRRKNRS